MNSIMQKNREKCFLCEGRANYRDGNLEEHHCFGGPNRKLSEKYGLKVYLHAFTCHREGQAAVHKDRASRLFVQGEAQKAFEKTHTREEFMKIFGKNYLPD